MKNLTNTLQLVEVGLLNVTLDFRIIRFVHRNEIRHISLRLKKPNFSVVLETKNANGQAFCMGGGRGFRFKGKRTVNPLLWLLPPVALFQYVIKKNKAGVGLELPEETAVEIIEALGSAIFV